jgi:hypothetical protein
MLSNPFQSFLRRLNNSRGQRQRIKRSTRRNGRRTISQQERECGSAAETLEERVLLTAAPVAVAGLVAHPTFIIEGRESTPGNTAVKQATSGTAQPAPVAPIDPAQMEAAYGVNLISFGGVKGTGAGQTIAIVDAYNDPDIISDANSFSSTFGLPQFNISGSPTLQVLNETGGTNLSGVPNSTPGGWDVEESLDVEWAHSIAPQANIILFEANSNSYSDLLTAEETAAATPGVSTVSNSWGSSEFDGEQGFDSYFTTPAGHQGVTFLASAGDYGVPALYPAYSPNVVAVGGTTLELNSSGTYEAESAWSGTGGGVSQFESQPTYQTGKVNGTSSTNRTAPDVSLDADPNTGVYVLDSYFGGYLQVGGTSLSSPMMAGLVSIADQGRVLNGLTTLDGPSQTLPLLYDLSSSNFRDITTGNNGFAAGPGYDLASGLGSPIANDLVTALAGYQSSQPATVTAPLSVSLIENGTYTFSGTISAADAAASGSSDSLSLSVIDGTLNLKSTTGLTFTSGVNGASSMTVTGSLANLNAAINGLRYTPTPGFSGADFLQVSIANANDNQTGWASINIAVNPLVPPALLAPSAATVLENRVYVFANGSIALTDAVASGTSDSVSLFVNNGYLTLDSTTGLIFAGGTFNASSSMTFSGTLGNLNAALNGLVYTPNSNYTGPDSLVISAKDSGDNLTGSATVAITVAKITAPSVTAPATASLNANSSFTFSVNAISVSDAAATGTSDSLSLSVSNGTLSLGSTAGLSFSGGSNDSSSMTVTGTLANLNAALDGLVYTPNADYSGGDSLQITVKDTVDGLSGPATVALTVTGLGAPVLTAPSLQVLNEGTSLTFSPANGNTIIFSDSGASGTSDSMSVSVTNGTLTLGSVGGLVFNSGTANGTSSITVTGTLTNLNAALNGLVYTPNPNYMGSDSLQIVVKDSADNKSASATVPLAVAGWTDLTNQVANNEIDDGVNLTLLLPNGDLLAHGAGAGNYSNDWYELTPAANGSYVNGTWQQVASMSVGRLYFGSVVLSNDNVFVTGGEYSSDGGFSSSAETYNPFTNVWTLDAPDPQVGGDDDIEVLPNGNVLVASILTSGTEIYNPSTNVWTPGGSKYYSDDINDEENWLKLPNGDILTYDIWASIDANKFLAEIYNPTTNTWSDASNSATGATLPLLSTPETGYESGVGALLPNGLAMLVGTNGNVVYYNDQTNSWTIGPSLPVVNINGVPTQLTAGDAPAAVLPDGNVVMAISPAVDDEDYPPPQYIYEFNPTTGVYTDITPTSPAFYANYNSFIDDMLVLPTGQIFLTDFGTDPLVLTPGGNPEPSWKPTITSFTSTGGDNYTLTGTQLNGMDEGGYYGDDNQMATNYPIVQVTDDLTGDVYYATTSNWSSNWVQTGNTPETVNVAMPSGIGNDPYSLEVIGSGIASNPYYSNGGPPIVTAPSSANVTENVAFTFGSNAISVADLGASGTSDSLTLTVGDGKLTLGATSGLTFSSGSNGTSSMTVTGTLAHLNAAVDGLVYTPNTGYTGSDSLQISLADSGDNLTAPATVAITVSLQTPADITAPTAINLSENSTYTFSGSTINVQDGSASGTSDSLTLTVGDGKLTLGSTSGLTFNGGSNGTSSMTVTGTLANLNAALSGLIYAPSANYYGGDSLQISVFDSNDGLTGPASVSITVTKLPTPNIAAPSSETIGENSLLTFANGSITLTDPGASGASDSLMLSAAKGTLLLGSTTGLTFNSGSNNSSSITVTGTLTNLNAAVSGLRYTPNAGYFGTDSLQFLIKNSLDGLSAPADVAITIDAPPVISAPTTASVSENSTYTFSGGAISLTDAAASGSSDSLTLSVQEGTLTLGSTTGLTFGTGSNGSSSITVTGTLTNLNAAVQGLVYTPNTGFYGSDSLQITVYDSGDRQSGSAAVGLTVNALVPPTVSAPSLVALVENSSYTFSSGALGLTDAVASGSSDSLSLSVSDGTLTLGSTTGLTFSTGSNGLSSMTVTGTLANLSAAVTGLVYTPSPSFIGNDSLQVTLKDSVDNLQGSATVTLDVLALAAPSIAAPQTVKVGQNASYTFASGAIVVTDGDAIGNTIDSLSLSVSDGKLALGSTLGLTFSGGFNGTSSMTVTGALANLNTALSGLVYTPTAGFGGHDSLAISVKDLSDNLPGSATVAIAVDPVVSAPLTAKVNENASLTFSAGNNNAITLLDGAATAASESLTLSVTNGKLALGSTNGISISAGSNNSSSMTITGTLANLTAAVSGLTFTPTTGYSGSAALAITLADSGDSLSGSANVAITVNSLPAVSAPASEKVIENASFTFSSANSDAITVTDAAASGTSDSVTLTVIHGRLVLGSTTGVTVTSGSNNSSSMTINGTLANLNAALNGLVYTPNAGFTGSDTLAITVNDVGDNATATGSVALTVSARSIGVGVVLAGTTATTPATTTSPDAMTTSTSTTNDESTQWAGVTAAVEVLNG